MDQSTLTVRLHCYRLYAWNSEVDEDQLWQAVQSWGGHMECRADCLDFFIPDQYLSWFLLQWDQLTPQPHLSYL